LARQLWPGISHAPATSAPAGEKTAWLLSRPATGEEFDAGELIGGVGLVNGDVVVVAPVATEPPVAAGGPPIGGGDGGVGAGAGPVPAGVWVVEVTGGPDTGRRLALDEARRHLVGRDRSADLALSDPGIGRADLSLAWDGVRLLVEPAPGVTVVVDGVPGDAAVALAPGMALRRSATVLELRHRVECPPVVDRTWPTVSLHRSPANRPDLAPTIIGPPAGVPDEEEPASFAYLAALMPLVMGIALAVVFSPRFLLFAALAPLVAVAGHLDQRRRSRRRRRRSEARFAAALDDVCHQASAALAAERRVRRLRTPDLAELGHRIRNRSPTLWWAEGPRGALPVRLGTGTVTPAVEVRPPTGGAEERRTRAIERLRPFGRLVDAPATLDLDGAGLIGLAGADSVVTPLAAAMVLQVAAAARPDDTQLAAAVGPHRAMGGWLPWLPHAREPCRCLPTDRFVTGGEEADELLAAIVDEAERRADQAGHHGPAGGERPARSQPRLVAVIDGDLDFDPPLVARLERLQPGLGITVLWLTRSEQEVPANATAVVACPPRTAAVPARAHRPVGSGNPVSFWPDGVAPDVARELARGLAPLAAATGDGDAVMPATVTLADVLEVEGITGEAVAGRWRRSRHPGLAAPVGHDGRGPLHLDLVADGPHCLIGGTSGSGKSELTISLVAGLLASHPPERLNVLFVDIEVGDAAHGVGGSGEGGPGRTALV
ncbi:MAG: FtsK/SpoIIIE domain-containing protein, partial [Actinomycetota bacterium]